MGIETITSAEELRRQMDAISARCSPANGNLLINREFSERWIAKGQVRTYQTGNAMFLLRKRSRCSRCYFLCEDMSCLPEDFGKLFSQTDETVITSILDRNGMHDPIKDVLLESGFCRYAKLNRVSMLNVPRLRKEQNVVFAEMSDLPQIEKIIKQYFDPLKDQNPDVDEIAEAIEGKRIIVARLPENGMVVAFQSFEKIGKTLHGRYVAAMEEYRKKVPAGGILWRQCIKMHCDVNKVIGWIEDGNDATRRWNRSMGLQADGVTDEIFMHSKN